MNKFSIVLYINMAAMQTTYCSERVEGGLGEAGGKRMHVSILFSSKFSSGFLKAALGHVICLNRQLVKGVLNNLF